MNRREFSSHVLAAGWGVAGLALAPWAHAQGGFVEGQHYVRLSQPLSVPAGGKIEVLEFFWYGCPHCNAFEPALQAWVKKLPADVAFRRVHVGFSAIHETHARIFYALDALGQVETLHRKVFYAIHNDRQRLDKPADIAAFMAKNGVDSAKFLDVFNSFSVQTKARQAKALTEAYKIDGVPAIGVAGRYYTSGTLAGTTDASLAVAEFLIQKVRKGA